MLKTDYLVVGAGAAAMAFVDTLLAESDANVLIVDRCAKPGGHWNYAYPFVTLHQPSQFYGVSSKELSDGRTDTIGLNKGLSTLATGTQILTYFDEVMQNTFLPSGRVKYFPLCEYKGNREFESRITGEKFEVQVDKKVVDCTFYKIHIPSTHTPNFHVDEGVSFIPINDLPNVSSPPEGFVIIGGGKTGIDACLWLLEHEVDPNDISWIVSRDAWLLDRENTQPTEAFFEQTIGTWVNQFEAVAQAISIPDLFNRLEKLGALVRIDQKVQPNMFRGATISQLELEQLRRIKNVIRLGRVQRIEKDRIILDEGNISTTPRHIHVDCSASAISHDSIKPVFEEGLITPQLVRPYQPVFSASFIAYVEARYPNDEVKNGLCKVVPLPNEATSWINMMMIQMANQYTWIQDRDLSKWLLQNRLNGFGRLINSIDKNDESKKQLVNRLREVALPAMVKFQQFVAELASA